MTTLAKQYNPFSSTLVNPSINSFGEVWCISPSNKYIYFTRSGGSYDSVTYPGKAIDGTPIFGRLDVTGVQTPTSVTTGTLVNFPVTLNNNSTAFTVGNLSNFVKNITACSNSVFFVFCSQPFSTNYGLFQIFDGSINKYSMCYQRYLVLCLTLLMLIH